MICWHWRGTAFTVDFSFFAVAALVAVRGGALYFLLLFLACLLHELGHLAMLLCFTATCRQFHCAVPERCLCRLLPAGHTGRTYWFLLQVRQ